MTLSPPPTWIIDVRNLFRWMHRRLSHAASHLVTSQYKGIITLVVESGALYAAVQVRFRSQIWILRNRCNLHKYIQIISLILNYRSSMALPIVLDLIIPLIVCDVESPFPSRNAQLKVYFRGYYLP